MQERKRAVAVVLMKMCCSSSRQVACSTTLWMPLLVVAACKSLIRAAKESLRGEDFTNTLSNHKPDIFKSFVVCLCIYLYFYLFR